jgi:hypothetical protein
MIQNIFRQLLLFPFECFDALVSAFTHSHKPKEIESPEVQKLRKELLRLYALNQRKEDLNELQQGRIEEMEYRHRLEIKQIEDHWRKIVRDLERQLSEARMQIVSQHN